MANHVKSHEAFNYNCMPKFKVHLAHLCVVGLGNLFGNYNMYKNILQPNYYIWCSPIFTQCGVGCNTIVS